jgi:hypothetical protein
MASLKIVMNHNKIGLPVCQIKGESLLELGVLYNWLHAAGTHKGFIPSPSKRPFANEQDLAIWFGLLMHDGCNF